MSNWGKKTYWQKTDRFRIWKWNPHGRQIWACKSRGWKCRKVLHEMRNESENESWVDEEMMMMMMMMMELKWLLLCLCVCVELHASLLLTPLSLVSFRHGHPSHSTAKPLQFSFSSGNSIVHVRRCKTHKNRKKADKVTEKSKGERKRVWGWTKW